MTIQNWVTDTGDQLVASDGSTLVLYDIQGTQYPTALTAIVQDRDLTATDSIRSTVGVLGTCVWVTDTDSIVDSDGNAMIFLDLSSTSYPMVLTATIQDRDLTGVPR